VPEVVMVHHLPTLQLVTVVQAVAVALERVLLAIQVLALQLVCTAVAVVEVEANLAQLAQSAVALGH